MLFCTLPGRVSLGFTTVLLTSDLEIIRKSERKSVNLEKNGAEEEDFLHSCFLRMYIVAHVDLELR